MITTAMVTATTQAAPTVVRAAASASAGMAAAALATHAIARGGGNGGTPLTSCAATAVGSVEGDAPGNNFLAPRKLATALAPSILVGSTAAFFATSTLGSSSLSPVSGLLMGLLAIQYSLQPRVSKACLDRRINKRSVAMVEEFVKIGIASAFLAWSGRAKLAEALQGWTLSSSLIVAGIPAAIYAVQGVLYVFSYQNLDSVTFNGLAQTKTLSAALCCFLLLGQRQSPVQISALFALACSALVFQGHVGRLFSAWGRGKGGGGSGTVEASSAADDGGNGNGTRFALGIVPCLAASFLSGLAGALSQKGLQITGGAGGRNAYLYTVEVSGFSALCLSLSILAGKGRSRRRGKEGGTAAKKDDGDSSSAAAAPPGRFFDHWTPATFYPIILKAIGGVLTALVHKHAGTVAKGFAVICGLVLSGVFQNLLDDEHLSLEQFVGIALVNLSSWLHFANPPLF